MPAPGTPTAGPVIDGLSSRALSEIAHLERTRGHLGPGDALRAVRRWKEYVHRPGRGLWEDHERGDVHGYCCGDPFESRVLLDTLTRAVSPRGARELRRVVGRYDAVRERR